MYSLRCTCHVNSVIMCKIQCRYNFSCSIVSVVISDEHVTGQVNHRTKLVAGAMVTKVMSCNRTWAEDVTRRLETLLGSHGGS